MYAVARLNSFDPPARGRVEPDHGPRHTRRMIGEVQAVDRSQEASLRALYDEHAPALLGYALRLSGGDRAQAEDVVQETLIRAWRHPEATDGARGPIRPWLFTVAHRIAIDGFRMRQARPREVGDAVLAAVPATDEVRRRPGPDPGRRRAGRAVRGAPCGDRRDLLPRSYGH